MTMQQTTIPWQITQLGAAQVSCANGEWALTLPAGSAAGYHDAQISDYESRRDFHNTPPLRLSLAARFAGELRGTAGFGFWNHAFVPGERGFRLPQALWFFHSSLPGDIALAKGLPGHGWKAATFDARNWRFLGLLPLAPLGCLMMRSRRLYDALWGLGQGALGVQEALLDAALLREYHRYSIDWRAEGAVFRVDDTEVLRADLAPGSRLGFVAWVDNQYVIVKPQGHFGRGTLEVTHSQSLHIRDLRIARL
ncbi:MAG: hypothetical protein OXG92_10280 [Chloroflexi bacterium]|nr:hypothetical protein [Chloroflexota bacterium]MCY3581806.1 hypothetical protein [Chloroflexota bacterium]MCY3716838.1 hypothetical protein [Chloroflexota bacterium]MDE2649676.1 hypothetical protein [Chloroflexota bacterium]MXX51141.1 hypothetical protein [Chloroflexota bacterium]